MAAKKSGSAKRPAKKVASTGVKKGVKAPAKKTAKKSSAKKSSAKKSSAKKSPAKKSSTNYGMVRIDSIENLEAVVPELISVAGEIKRLEKKYEKDWEKNALLRGLTYRAIIIKRFVAEDSIIDVMILLCDLYNAFVWMFSEQNDDAYEILLPPEEYLRFTIEKRDWTKEELDWVQQFGCLFTGGYKDHPGAWWKDSQWEYIESLGFVRDKDPRYHHQSGNWAGNENFEFKGDWQKPKQRLRQKRPSR